MPALVATLVQMDATTEIDFISQHGRRVIIAAGRGALLDPADPAVEKLVKKGHLRPQRDIRPYDGSWELPWSGDRRSWR
jgi:hypothetical protein